MVYNDALRDPVSRTLKIYEEYDGEYPITMLMNTFNNVAGRIIEYYTKISRNNAKISDISKMILRYNSEMELRFQYDNDEQREFRTVRALRNSFAHYTNSFIKYDYCPEEKTDIRLRDERIVIVFTVENLKKLLYEIADLLN